MKKVFVTGGNSGIGLAICKQLVSEHACHVFLGARNAERGKAAVEEINKEFPKAEGKVELVTIDVSNDESVAKASKTLADGKHVLYGIVNNAGVGLSHEGITATDIINVNLQGPRRVVSSFLGLLDPKAGRIVNMSSGAASGYVKGEMMGNKLGCCTAEDKACLSDPGVEWKQIMAVVEKEREGKMNGWTAYGLSKACLTAYTMQIARENPSITAISCSPGYIATNMTKNFQGNKLPPAAGTVSTLNGLFGDVTSGWYYGSDAKRSPLSRGRDPGEPEYDPKKMDYK